MATGSHTSSITMLAGSLSRRGGGVYNAILGQAYALAELGAKVSLVGPADPYSVSDKPPGTVIDVNTVRSFGTNRLRVAPGLARALLRVGGDLVHLHGLWAQPSLSLAAWRRRTERPTVISPHGMLDPWAL